MVDQNLCSHDAPDQQPGTPCIRCGKMMPGEAPKQEAPKEIEVEEVKEEAPKSRSRF